MFMNVLDGTKFQGPFGMDQMSYGHFGQKPNVLHGFKSQSYHLYLQNVEPWANYLIRWLPFSYRDFVRIPWDFPRGEPWIINNFSVIGNLSFSPSLWSRLLSASQLKPDRSLSPTSVKSCETMTPLVPGSVPLAPVRTRTELDLQPFFALSISTLEGRMTVKLTGY